MGNHIDDITIKAVRKLEMMLEGSQTSSRFSNQKDSIPNQWQIIYSVPDAAHLDMEKFKAGLSDRIAKALGTERGVKLNEPVESSSGRQTIAATLTGDAFTAMDNLEEEVEKAAHAHER
jgi:hypothetical protein